MSCGGSAVADAVGPADEFVQQREVLPRRERAEPERSAIDAGAEWRRHRGEPEQVRGVRETPKRAARPRRVGKRFGPVGIS